jgi:hypothetical protein
MSHVERTKLRIKDMRTFAEAVMWVCPEARVEKAQEYRWYGRHVGDHPLPEGFKKEDIGKCEYKVTVPGINYEIGLAKPEGEDGYALMYDYYGQQGRHDGRKLLDKFGTGCVSDGLSKLANEYRHLMLVKEAKRMGKTVERIDSEEKLTKWNKAMRRIDQYFQPVKWKGKMLSVVMGR